MVDVCFTHLPISQEGYKYSTSGLYFAPTAETIEEFVTYIKGQDCGNNGSKCLYKSFHS